MNYDEIADQIKNKAKTKRQSIFEPHFDLVVALLKKGVKQVDIMNYIKEIDESIDAKNSNTLQTLFNQYVNSKRIQKLVSPQNVIIKTTKVVQKNSPISNEIVKGDGNVSKSKKGENENETEEVKSITRQSDANVKNNSQSISKTIVDLKPKPRVGELKKADKTGLK